MIRAIFLFFCLLAMPMATCAQIASMSTGKLGSTEKALHDTKEIHHSTAQTSSSDPVLTTFWQVPILLPKPKLQIATAQEHRTDAFLRLNILSSKHHPPTA